MNTDLQTKTVFLRAENFGNPKLPIYFCSLLQALERQLLTECHPFVQGFPHSFTLFLTPRLNDLKLATYLIL